MSPLVAFQKKNYWLTAACVLLTVTQLNIILYSTASNLHTYIIVTLTTFHTEQQHSLNKIAATFLRLGEQVTANLH